MIDSLRTPWRALRVALGAMAFLAGLDKFFNILADWAGCLGPLAGYLPLSSTSLMHIVGVIEVLVGLAILAGYTRLGAYVAAMWLLAIAANLVTTGHDFDVAVRDAVLTVAAFTLAKLSEAGAGASAGGHLVDATVIDCTGRNAA